MSRSRELNVPTGLERSSRRKFRQVVLRVHTWLGLHMCLVFALMFFTGVLSLFSPEMDVGIRPDLYITPPAPETEALDYGDIYDTVIEGENARAVTAMHAPGRPWLGHKVAFTTASGTDRVAWVHPATGEILGTTRPDPLFIKTFVLRLHDTFMIPLHAVKVGLMSLSIVLLASIVTGLITYRRFWKGFFRWPARDAPHRVRHGAWHRLAAVWALPFLIIMGVTAFLFLVTETVAKPVYAPVEKTPVRETVLPEGFNGASVSRALEVVRRDMPGFEVNVLTIPDRRFRTIVVTGHDHEHHKMFGVSTMWIDPETERSLGVVRTHSDSATAVIASLASTIHYGKIAGQWVVVLWALLGLLGCFLFLTGARVYAARTVVEAGGSTKGQGTLGTLWQGLGMFRWLYVLFALAILGSTIAQAVT